MDNTKKKMTIIVTVAVTLSTLLFWAATGFHAYTKYQVVEIQDVPIAKDDPFAGTGLYDAKTKSETFRRDEFHLGFLPTPQGIFDKHLVSVSSIVVPIWMIAGTILWLDRRSRNKAVKQQNSGISMQAKNGSLEMSDQRKQKTKSEE